MEGVVVDRQSRLLSQGGTARPYKTSVAAGAWLTSSASTQSKVVTRASMRSLRNVDEVTCHVSARRK